MMTVGDIRRQLEGVPDEAVIYAEIETEIEDLCCAKVLGFRLRSFDGFPVLGVVVRVTEEDECDLCSDDDEEEDGEAWEVDADRREVAEIYERIHRSNLVGMGVLPLQFLPGETRDTLGLTGKELFDVTGIADALTPRKILAVVARREDGSSVAFRALARVDAPVEIDYLAHGGILPAVLRQIIKAG
jgi:hypothetical protein